MSPEMPQWWWEPELLKADMWQTAVLHPSCQVALGPSWTSERNSKEGKQDAEKPLDHWDELGKHSQDK